MTNNKKELIETLDSLLKKHTATDIIRLTEILDDEEDKEIFQSLWTALENETWNDDHKDAYVKLTKKYDEIHPEMVLIRLEVAKLKTENKI